VWTAIRRADCVRVPSDLGPATRTKSANRVLEAIHGGRLTLASPLPAYLEFADFCRLGDSRAAAGILSGSVDREAVAHMLQAGQAYVPERYLPMHAAAAWDNVFRNA
jgi:hypothetical protein